MGLKRALLAFLVLIIVSATLLVSLPGIPPDIKLESFEIKPPIKSEGWFATNAILDEAELYLERPGIESMAVQNDDVVFTGDQTGTILKITAKHMAEDITTLRFPCGENPFGDGTKRRDTCGWPLGMRLYKEQLFVMDYYGGLTKVDVKTGVYENIIPKSRPINDVLSQIPEDLDISKDGTVYWTDGSTNGNFYVEMIGQPSGRLIKYDPVARKNEVLLENLHFSNGVCLSDDEEFVLVVETGSSKVTRYYLTGKKKGHADTFVDSLPGYPDNIRSNGRGGFYLALALPWNDEYSMKNHLLSPRPLLRKLILRSRHLLLNMINYVQEFFPRNIYLNLAEKYVQENGPISNWNSLSKTATVVELSKTGEVIGILNGKTGKISLVSQITVGKDYAFLCSPLEGKIWRIKLNALRRMH